ncbi:MAG: alpha-glucosidase/alpha-galactosidase [Treponemataceae bacterium]|nr:MAG: alpha-glucosidase/alpha-galactosidase [Treponemataceae bacterium]
MQKSKEVKICYIGGGSRNWAWVLFQDLCFEKDFSAKIELYDIDVQSARDNETLANNLLSKHNGGRFSFHANASLEDSLTGSDFVFISILPADFEQMAVDVHAPEKYGIYQSVGDTAGPGGIMRSMRAIPLYQTIAAAIQKYAPSAWVLNYTNPMTICTRALYEAFPAIKAFGCCHEVFNTQKLLRTVLEMAGVIEKGAAVAREEIITEVAGINHFTWITKASYKGIDIFPHYADFAEKYAESGLEREGAPSDSVTSFGSGDHFDWRTDFFASAERVKLDLFRRYALIAAEGDRHLAEFCPHAWYLANPKVVESWKFSLTPVSWRIENRESLKAKSAAFRNGSETLTPNQSGEEGLKIIKALLGLGNMTTNVNLPNIGQLSGLPQGAVVETNAFFSRDNVQPLVTKALPPALNELVSHHVYAQEALVKAVFARNIEEAFRVFASDLSIQTLPLHDARTLFDDMCAKTLGKSWE